MPFGKLGPRNTMVTQSWGRYTTFHRTYFQYQFLIFTNVETVTATLQCKDCFYTGWRITKWNIDTLCNCLLSHGLYIMCRSSRSGLLKTKITILCNFAICWYYRRLGLQQIRGAEHLKGVLVVCWEQISQEFIDQAIEQFRKRLISVIAVTGGHVEHSWLMRHVL